MKKLRYVAYLRKSTEDEERQVLSKEAQRDKIIERFNDLDIVDFLDESKSAFDPGKRHVFETILNMLDSGQVDGIVAWHPDRLSRNAIDAAAISHRITRGIIKDLKFASFSFDNSPEGVMMLQMTMSQSQYFSSKLSKDVKRGNERKRSLGGLTGRAPEGYLNDKANKTVIVDEIRFPLIRKAFDLYLTGDYSVQQVLGILNKEWGYTTVRRSRSGGSPLSKSALYNIFRNVRYAGLIPDPLSPEKYYEANFTAMVTQEEYDQVQRLLGDAGRPRLCASKQFALKGFIRCGECNCMITAETKSKKLVSGVTRQHTYYHCTRKRPCAQRAYVKEGDLFKQLEELISTYEITPELYEWGIEALKELADSEISERNNIQSMQFRSITDLQKQLDTLLDMATKGLVSASEYETKSTKLKADLADRQNEQADSSNRAKNWYEFVGNTLNTLTYANKRFTDGDLGDKKEVLMAIGQNPVLINGKLVITPNFWLEPVSKKAGLIKEQIEKVRTMPQQMQKAPEQALRQDWQGRVESNHDLRFWRPLY